MLNTEVAYKSYKRKNTSPGYPFIVEEGYVLTDGRFESNNRRG